MVFLILVFSRTKTSTRKGQDCFNIFLKRPLHVYLKELQRDRRGEKAKEREIASFCWHLLRMAATVRADPGRSQKLHSGVPHGGRAQVLRPSSAAIPRLYAGNQIGNRLVRTQISTQIGCWTHRQWLYLQCPNAGRIILIFCLSHLCKKQEDTDMI